MEVIPLDATLVRGSHGRVTDRTAEGPLFMTTEPALLKERIRAEEVYGMILAQVFSD